MVEPQAVALPFILASFHALSELWMSRPGFFRTIFGWILSAAAAAGSGDGRWLELGAGAGAVRHRHLGAGRGHAARAQCVPVAAWRRRDQRAGPGAGVVLARPLRQHRAADVFRQWLERPRHRGLARCGLDAVAAAGGALSLDLLEDACGVRSPATCARRSASGSACASHSWRRPAWPGSSPAGSWSGLLRDPSARCRCWGRVCWRPRRSSRRTSTPWCPASSHCSSASFSSDEHRADGAPGRGLAPGVRCAAADLARRHRPHLRPVAAGDRLHPGATVAQSSAVAHPAGGDPADPAHDLAQPRVRRQPAGRSST